MEYKTAIDASAKYLKAPDKGEGSISFLAHFFLPEMKPTLPHTWNLKPQNSI